MVKDRHHLRLIKNPDAGRGRIVVAPYHSPPFSVQGLVLEEDTWFALSSTPEFHDTSDHPIRVMTEAWEAEPATPGSVCVRGGYPYRILAVVHDLSQDPTWRIEWIDLALRHSLEAARAEGLRSIGIEPLGAVHGRFQATEFDTLLRRVVDEDPYPPLDIWRIELQR
jgi:hypothetical protein